MVEISCLKAEVESGSRRYPVFIGFLEAEAVASIAAAPSFSPSTPHRDIAVNVLEPPVEDWQRPLDIERVDKIRSTFNNSGALMPNPVLLSANGVAGNGHVRIRRQSASGSIPTDIWVVEVDEPDLGDPRPLWILDGQHRIQGLAASRQKRNRIPVVLLLNDSDHRAYSGSDFAELFAQVTTSAQKLDALHNEWLTYAFELDDYDPRRADHVHHKRAMTAVAELCRRSNLSDGQPNPFANAVRFNPENPQARIGGFSYNCSDLKELLRRHYFGVAPDPLEPAEVGEQVALAILGLKEVVRAPQEESVFFGTSEFGQLPMQDAFIIGLLAHLRVHGPPSDWKDVLERLAFSETDWRFKTWINSLSGKSGTVSRQLAERVFASVFSTGQLPGGVTNLADHLKGNRARLRLVFSYLTPAGRPRTADSETVELSRGDNITHSPGDRRHVRVARVAGADNIGRLEVLNALSRPGAPIRYPAIARGGVVLDDTFGEGRLQLVFHMEHYGGLTSEAEITLTW